ncbi:NAD(P)H-binding protein [Aquisalimonas sp.]|uniref:NAD(P)-dependent oxidoreductase n=1 Tax=Aquisalimonas sp. TaxID=1872621 RepID=UPI0025C3B0B4|nr:NAD(P)H-binding protein [Aquisalimonas sp.]
MKIAVFGGSGQTGLQVLRAALDKGYEVNALVRNPDKVDPDLCRDHASKLHLVKGDLLNDVDVAKALEGCEGFIFAAGPVKGGHPDLPNRAARVVLSAAKEAGVKRFVWLLGAAVIDERDAPDFSRKIIRTIMKLTARNVLESSERAYQQLVRSGMDYTVVRPPVLVNTPAKGTLKGSYQPPKPSGISREDLGRYMVDALTDSQLKCHSPMLSYS